MFNAAKDALTSATARKFLSSKIARYGELRTLRIDSKRKTVTLVCDLIGEADPIEVQVGKYTVEAVDGRDFVCPSGFSCNRPWITKLLEDYVEGRRFEVPGWAKAAL